MYNEVTLTDNKSNTSPVPTTDEYREALMEQFLERKIKKIMAAKLFNLGGLFGKKKEVVEEPPKEDLTMTNASAKLEASEIDKNFFPTFESMTDCSLELNDRLRDFIGNSERKFITFFDNLKAEDG